MKTTNYKFKKMFASMLAIISFAFFSFQAKAQGCQAGFTFSVNSTTINFTNTSTGSSSPHFVWSFGDGNYDWQTNAVHSYSINGTYAVCLTMYDSLNFGCQSTYCDSIVITNAVNPPCNAFFVYYGDSANQNQSQFYDLSSNNPVSWSWTFGDGGTSTQQNPIHQYAQPGYYMACLTIVDANADTCTYCDTVAYFPCTITAGFTFNTSNDPQVTFTNTSSGGYSPSYSWNFGDGSSASSTNAMHTYQYSGSYVVCLTAYDSVNSCYDAYCDSITIVNAPAQPCVAQFYAYPDSSQNTIPGYVYFYDVSTGGATSWSWSFGDGTSSTMQNPMHQYSQFGTYWVCLTITTPTSSCSTCDSVSNKILGSGIQDNEIIISQIQNFPNPFYSTTTIKYTLDKNSNVNIAVYDRIGSKVAELESSDKSAGQHELEWNAANLPAGIYHLELKAGASKVSRKLVLIK